MKTKKQLAELLSTKVHLTEIPEDKSSYYGYYNSIVDANIAAINRIQKPQDWSLLYDGKTFMIVRDKSVKDIMQKYKSWKLVGAYDSEGYIKKKLINIQGA